MKSTITYKSLKIILLAIPAGLFLFSFVTFFLVSIGMVEASSSGDIGVFRNLVPIAIVLGVGGSYLLGNKLLKSAKTEKGLANKLKAYQKMSIIKTALLEVPGLIAVVAALLTGEIQFLFVAMAIVVVMVIGVPTKEKVMEMLELSPSDRQKFK
ncbi:MAG: hypothetical protein NXI00_21715 [Cytophagales bacterium]|nr:hypothetical protein [Cytophagales bacterium]